MDLERQKMVSELDEYIASCKNRLKNILSALDWTEEVTLEEKTCSVSLAKEQKEDKDDPLLPGSFDCMHSVVIDKDHLKEILKTDNVSIPKKFSDIQLNFTREQKRELYDHVIYNTGKISEPELKVSVSNDDQNGNDMTFAEIVAKAKKKDKKLQRKYRTSKPTHIEEVRNLVHLQMQALAQYFNPKPSTPEVRGHRRYRDEDVERRRRRSKSRNREKPQTSYLRRRPRSCSRDMTSRSRERESRSKERRSRFKERRSRNTDIVQQSRDVRTPSRDRKCSSKDMKSRSTTRDNRRSESSSPTRPTNRRKEKHKSSSTKNKKKRSRSRSRANHKSSKSKKSKHKHRELKIKQEIKETQP